MNIEDITKNILEIYEVNKNKPRTNSEKHNGVQNEICNLAEKYGYTWWKEYSCIYSEVKKGFIDVVWCKDNVPMIAIEIDSSVRPKSVEKLLSFNGERIWVYYGEDKNKCKRTVKKLDKNKTIHLIML